MVAEKHSQQYWRRVFHGYSLSNLINVTGNTIELPPEFIGQDSDGDGIPDIVEEYGLKPNGEPIGTNKYLKDTDGDGLDDNVELNYFTDKLVYPLTQEQLYVMSCPKSDPTKKDTDNDGLDDLLDNAPTNSKIHEFVIYETEKNDTDLKAFDYNQKPGDFQYADKSKDDLKDMDWINWSDFALSNENDYEISWKLLVWLLSSGDMVDVSLDMVDHFMDGSGEDYHNDILSREVKNHENTTNYVNGVTEVFENLIKSYNGKIYSIKYDKNSRGASPMVLGMRDDNINMPIYNDYFSGLGICIDGLYGNRIEVTSYECDGTNYKYTLHFTMYDIYGLDETDITDNIANLDFAPSYGILAGFRSWYILQHYDKYNGSHRPYISYMEFDRTFEGTV